MVWEFYGDEFLAWVYQLINLRSRRQAGWSIDNNDLTPLEWGCMAIIEQHFRQEQMLLSNPFLKRKGE